MFSISSCFFNTSKTISSYLPSRKKILVASARVLAFGVFMETITEIGLAAEGTGLLPEYLNPYLPIFISLLVAIQSDLLLEGNELAANARRFANWLMGRKNINEVGVGGIVATNRNCLVKAISKIYTTITIPVLWISMFIVPPGQFLRSFYQMQQLLSNAELFNLDKTETKVLIASIFSGIIAAYYSLGTEGASAYDWLEENNAGCKCKQECCCIRINVFPSSFSRKLRGGTGVSMAILGAINHSFLESAAFYLLVKSLYSNIPTVATLAIVIFIDMGLQNFTFQGREFRKSFKASCNKICLSKNEIEYEEIKEHPAAELTMKQKVSLHIVNTFLIAVPAFAANFSLFTFTILSGFKSQYHQNKTKFWQDIIGISGGVVAATGEAFTETVSAFDEIEEWVSKKIDNNQQRYSSIQNVTPI